jgi:hypothetical protein
MVARSYVVVVLLMILKNISVVAVTSSNIVPINVGEHLTRTNADIKRNPQPRICHVGFF